MKRRVIILWIALSCIVMVRVGLAEPLTCKWFSIMLPSAAWKIDTQTYAGENTEDYRWIGMISEDGESGLCVDVEMQYVPSLAGYRLFEAEQDEIDAYALDIIASAETEGAKYIETVFTDAYSIPFVMLLASDQYGSFYYAETVANGWTISMFAYAYQSAESENFRALTHADYQKLTYLIQNFVPLKAE